MRADTPTKIWVLPYFMPGVVGPHGYKYFCNGTGIFLNRSIFNCFYPWLQDSIAHALGKYPGERYWITNNLKVGVYVQPTENLRYWFQVMLFFWKTWEEKPWVSAWWSEWNSYDAYTRMVGGGHIKIISVGMYIRSSRGITVQKNVWVWMRCPPYIYPLLWREQCRHECCAVAWWGKVLRVRVQLNLLWVHCPSWTNILSMYYTPLWGYVQ